ncbi:MAG: cation:proton antiporter [Planctomycetota bacterium]|jgi:Kef-type K+ transport system membrane component KefB
MNYFILSAAAEGGPSLNIILLMGIAIFFATIGGKIFQKLHIPQIVGYVVLGMILGPMVLKIIDEQTIKSFDLFNYFALGGIGFLIGRELESKIFVKYGRQVIAILLFEGLTAFFLVGTLSFLIMLCFYDWHTSLAVAVVFGAICSATDPASTISVLWEYKSRGPLTTMLTAIVALDDALALVLYAVGISIAGVIIGHGTTQGEGFWVALYHSLVHIFGALTVGVAMGLVLSWIIKRIEDSDKMLIYTISSVMLVIGIAMLWNLDVIIACMALGVTLVNIKSRRAPETFKLVHMFYSPVYVLFFVLVGARLNIAHVNLTIGLLVAAYVIGSIVGKTVG